VEILLYALLATWAAIAVPFAVLSLMGLSSGPQVEKLAAMKPVHPDQRGKL